MRAGPPLQNPSSGAEPPSPNAKYLFLRSEYVNPAVQGFHCLLLPSVLRCDLAHNLWGVFLVKV